jgi:hypothetical protein
MLRTARIVTTGLKMLMGASSQCLARLSLQHSLYHDVTTVMSLSPLPAVRNCLSDNLHTTGG